MEEVLEAVADNVATLVIALSQSDRVFGNIVPAAELIKSATDGMCEAAKVTAKSPAVQPDARALLEETSAALSAVSAKLVESATRGRDDAAGRATHQKEAIKSAKDLLQKVVLLVMLEDQTNIQTFVTSAKRTADVVARVGSAASPQQLSVVLPEATMAHQDFLKRARRRAELTKGDAKTEILAAIETIAAGTPRHLVAAQANVTAPTDVTKREVDDAGRVLVDNIDRLIAIVRDVFARNAKFIGAAFAFKAPTTTREDDVARYASELRYALERIAPAVIAGEDATHAARAFLSDANSLLSAARHVAVECSDPVQRRMIERCCEELSEVLPKLVAAIKPAADNPQNAAAIAELRCIAAMARDAGDMLQVSASSTPESAVASAGVLVAKNIADLRRAVEAGDSAKAKAELRQLERNYDRYVALASAMAEAIEDPVLRETARAAVAQLVELRPKLILAAQMCIDDPRNAEALRKLDEVIAQFSAAAQVISAPHLQGSAVSGSIARELDMLIDAASRKDVQSVVEHTKATALAMNTLLSTAAKALESCSDPQRRAAIEAAMAQCRELIPKLVEATKQFVKNPDSVAARQALESISSDTKLAASRLAQLLKPTAEEVAAENARVRAQLERQRAIEAEAAAERKRVLERARAEEIAKADAERKRVLLLEKQKAEEEAAAAAAAEAEKKKKLVVEGPVDARIMAAAEHVNSLPASSGADTPQGKLLDCSHTIAELMAQLSSYAFQGNKQGMIQTSRKIAAAVNDIVKFAQAIAAKCNDPRLRGDVLNYCQAAQNYSVQLKIMSAVKAASEENDPTVQDQLVTAATGLAASVVNTANSCNAASLHKSVRTAK